MRPLLLLACLLLPCLAQPKPGFFETAQKDGRWWLKDPKGRPFFCKAVNVFEIGADPAKLDPAKPAYSGLRHYPSRDAWLKAQLARLKSWGFNTLGGYTDHDFYLQAKWPYTVALAMGAWVSVPWLDPAEPASLQKFDELAQEVAAKFKNDPNLIGYFVDNELGWWDETLLTFWLTQPSTARPKREVMRLLEKEYGGDLKRLLKDFEIKPRPHSWKALEGSHKEAILAQGARPLAVEEFTGWMADQFYSLAAAAMRKADPNHLLLGDRYLSYYNPAVVRAAGKHMDVVSANYNSYSEKGWIAPAFFEGLYASCGKPIMVTEFYFSAKDNASGNRNLQGPFITVPTQPERAAGAEAMANGMASLPYIVGHHWFQYVDEPTFGRGDGEDFNFGLIDIHNQPYPLLTAAFTRANQGAEALHARSASLKAARPGVLPKAPAAGLTGDAHLGDWDLPASWLGPVPSTPRGPSPADFFAAWTPEGLWLAVGFQDYDTRQQPGGPPLFNLRITRQGGKAMQFSVGSFGGKATRQRLIGTGPRLPPLSIQGASKSSVGYKDIVGVNSLGEVFLSRLDLGGGEFKAGEKITLELSLKLKGADRTFSLLKENLQLGL